MAQNLSVVRYRSLVVAIVAITLTGSLWATCLEGATSSEMQQMACCKAGHDHCPMEGSASDCCQKSGPQVQSQAAIVKAATPYTPVLAVAAWAALPALAIVPQTQRGVSFGPSPPDSRVRPPAYILFSTLLI